MAINNNLKWYLIYIHNRLYIINIKIYVKAGIHAYIINKIQQID